MPVDRHDRLIFSWNTQDDCLFPTAFEEDIAWYEGPNREWIAFDYVSGEVQLNVDPFAGRQKRLCPPVPGSSARRLTVRGSPPYVGSPWRADEEEKQNAHNAVLPGWAQQDHRTGQSPTQGPQHLQEPRGLVPSGAAHIFNQYAPALDPLGLGLPVVDEQEQAPSGSVLSGEMSAFSDLLNADFIPDTADFQYDFPSSAIPEPLGPHIPDAHLGWPHNADLPQEQPAQAWMQTGSFIPGPRTVGFQGFGVATDDLSSAQIPFLQSPALGLMAQEQGFPQSDDGSATVHRWPYDPRYLSRPESHAVDQRHRLAMLHLQPHPSNLSQVMDAAYGNPESPRVGRPTVGPSDHVFAPLLTDSVQPSISTTRPSVMPPPPINSSQPPTRPAVPFQTSAANPVRCLVQDDEGIRAVMPSAEQRRQVVREFNHNVAMLKRYNAAQRARKHGGEGAQGTTASGSGVAPASQSSTEERARIGKPGGSGRKKEGSSRKRARDDDE